ncbi:Glutamate-ammonia ligase-like protein [Quillaja saponaria]|uniref:Glutamate-ammonia ligase-like protein n=1 Tax=Quillaja saponaria TaxID=32244 RepID=A0AAD7VE36_QUISA|nr:Glutamate-ammonia ligase-like protein [Quillaja saponaria]
MDFTELKKAVEEVELVDAHAHNIVALDSNFPFIRGFSEADGEALSYSTHSLSFKRSLREIAELYGSELSLHGIEQYRRVSGLQSISSICFEAARISAILIDDGLELDKKHDIGWHKTLAPVVGRLLRIERLAEKILDEGMPDGSSWTLDKFTETFVEKLKSVTGEIFGLKSIAAYRSGLEINTNVSKKDAEEGLTELLLAGKPVRITNKNLIDYVFLHSLEVALSCDLPMQIHTGFGDKDLDMRLANPLHLRSLLEDKRYSKCRLVLLHASYPFSKEASYLASVYPQVYLDFGLAIPKLSVHGMISSVKELLELAPIKKVMFSTDGYAFPETFYLGAKKAREIVFSVLHDACIDGDLSVPEAVEAANDIFAQNAIHFYKIDSVNKAVGSKDSFSPTPLRLKSNPSETDVSLVRVIWVDASGQHRCRVVPSKRFNDVVKKNGIGLTFASMGMTSFTDGPADETNLTGVGEIRLMPDLSTKWRIPWNKQEEMVLADMHLKPGEAWEYCPREALRRVSNILKDEFNLVLNAGFENEFFLLKSITREGKEEWVPIDSTPYCSISAFDATSPIFHEVIAALHSLNISVEQLHAEAGKGQFELALGHTVCTYAADKLIFTREVIRAVARKHGLLATFMPKYALDDIGSGSHVHISLWRNGENVFMASGGSSQHGISTVGEEFMAGVLYHLPSILALTAPLPNSYDRILPNTWSGAYQCWGRENREAPLRTACPPGVPDGLVSNFEIKSFDGCANPHLGLAAIVAAGIDGLRRHLSLPKPVDTNPDSLHDKLQRLPKSLSESVEALHEDDILTDLMGEKLMIAIKGIRKAEIDYYSKHKEAYKQLIHRY